MYHERSRSADGGTRSSKFDHIRRTCLGVGAYLIGIVASTALVGALSAPTAQAASDFDNTVNVIDNLIIDDSLGNGTRDYSFDWYTEAVSSLDIRCQQEGNNGSWCENRDLLSNMMDSPTANWAVARTSVYEYVIIFSSDPTARVEFVDVGNGNSEARIISDNTLSFYQTSGFSYLSTLPSYGTTQGTVYFNQGGFDVYNSSVIGVSYNANWKLFLSTFPVIYPPGYEGEIIPGDVDPDPLYQDPWNLPASETADCDWWNLTCFMGTVDFNPIRDVTQQASQNLGFIAQFGQVIGELTEMMTAMPDFFAGVDPCWTTGTSSWCNIPVNIFDQQSNISLYHIRNSPVMQAIMPWLLYAMMGLMSWNLFKSLPKIVEDITRA